jgi:hypothetical protein
VILGTAEQCARLLASAQARSRAATPAAVARAGARGHAAGARCRASAIPCTGRSTRAPSGSSSSPTRAASSGPHVALARAFRDGVAEPGAAADDERLDADRRGAARPRLLAATVEGVPLLARTAACSRTWPRSASAVGFHGGRPRRRSRTSRAAELMLAPRSRRGRGTSSSRSTTPPTAPARLPLRALAFYRAKLGAAGFVARRGRRARRDRRAAADREARAAATTHAENPSARTSARRRDEIVRIYSTSGTTGTPSYIPLTAATSTTG